MMMVKIAKEMLSSVLLGYLQAIPSMFTFFLATFLALLTAEEEKKLLDLKQGSKHYLYYVVGIYERIFPI